VHVTFVVPLLRYGLVWLLLFVYVVCLFVVGCALICLFCVTLLICCLLLLGCCTLNVCYVVVVVLVGYDLRLLHLV